MRTNVLVALATVLFLPACGNGAADPSTAPGASPGSAAGTAVGPAPVLSSADLPDVAPCPAQAVLTDTARFAAFRTALLEGDVLYRAVPFDAQDPDIYRKKCGLDPFWDPADATDEIAPPTARTTLADLLRFGNAGICAAGFANTSFGGGEGFPVAGTYRKEFKVAHQGTTYLVRVRLSVAGPAAGETLASRSIRLPDDLESTLGYRVDGFPQAHADVFPALIEALQPPAATAQLEVLERPDGASLLGVLFEVLCVEVL